MLKVQLLMAGFADETMGDKFDVVLRRKPLVEQLLQAELEGFTVHSWTPARCPGYEAAGEAPGELDGPRS